MGIDIYIAIGKSAICHWFPPYFFLVNFISNMTNMAIGSQNTVAANIAKDFIY